MKKALIVTGGNINIKWFQNWLKNKKFNLIIAVDKGLEALDLLGIKPDYIIGDFDSINESVLSKYQENVITLNKEKDFTDTHEALKFALKLASTEIIIVGAIGSRLDHTLANVYILREALENNVKCTILNEHNKVFLINKDAEIKKDTNYKYVSILPLTENVEGITLTGFKYTLDNSELKIGQSIGVSNEQIEKTARIEIRKGILIIIYSKD